MCNFSWFLSVNWFKFCNTRVEITIRPEDCHGYITHTLHMIMLFCLLKLVWGERWLCPFFLFNFLICAYLFAKNGSDCLSEIKLLSGSIYEIKKKKKKRKEGNHLWLSYWFEFSNICLILKAFSLHLTCKFFSQICKSPQKFHVKLNSMVYSVLKLIFHVKCYLYMTVYHQSEVTFCSNMYCVTALWNFNFDLQR